MTRPRVWWRHCWAPIRGDRPIEEYQACKIRSEIQKKYTQRSYKWKFIFAHEDIDSLAPNIANTNMPFAELDKHLGLDKRAVPSNLRHPTQPWYLFCPHALALSLGRPTYGRTRVNYATIQDNILFRKYPAAMPACAGNHFLVVWGSEWLLDTWNEHVGEIIRGSECATTASVTVRSCWNAVTALTTCWRMEYTSCWW